MALPTQLKKLTSSTGFRLARYILIRIASILATIIVGVFIAVWVANSTGQIDRNVAIRVEAQARFASYEYGEISSEAQWAAYERIRDEMGQEAGLFLPDLQRHTRWTLNAMTLDWGDLQFLRPSPAAGPFSSMKYHDDIRTIVLERLPSTLILVGISYFLIFLIGVPFALSVSRKHGSWMDRLVSFLAPLSSVPSWVYGILLIFLFAYELRLLPFGGMMGTITPETPIGYIPIILKHLILPVTAIVLGLLFQLVYTWRTFFQVYSQEDYVELGLAMGLSPRAIERKYILKPSLPFVITSFALTLVGFWQTTTALELILDWPGIGQLYIQSLPHFWGLSMFPGEMVVTVAVVVIFSYLLGFTVLVLDVIYAIVDPRIRMGAGSSPALKAVGKRPGLAEILRRWKLRRSSARRFKPRGSFAVDEPLDPAAEAALRKEVFRSRLDSVAAVWKELIGYPSAVFGLLIIVMLIGGSIYAMIAFPYLEVGDLWSREQLTGSSYVPRLARPAWTNLFRKDDLLSVIMLDSQDGTASKEVEPGSGEGGTVLIEFTFDYSYGALPEEITLYFAPEYDIKRPFVFMTWIAPDGREIELKALSIPGDMRAPIEEYMPGPQSAIRELDEPEDTQMGNEEYLLLFTDPALEGEALLKGEYALRIEGLTFEDGGDLDAELVLLGQVYGAAGTDFMRRDLLVPMLWGMPFALAIGLVGAILTTVAAMVIAAAGVWFGGWVDALIQRITEANMIMPVLAIAVLFYAIFDIDLWTILAVIILLSIFSGPTKSFRAAFLQVKEAPYIEAAQAYGATNWRIIIQYMIPRIIPVIVPQLVALVPAFVFLEATLGIFNIKSMYPTWGKVIYQALRYGASWGSRYYVLFPIVLLLLTGYAFAMIGFALDRILNPRLRDV